MLKMSANSRMISKTWYILDFDSFLSQIRIYARLFVKFTYLNFHNVYNWLSIVVNIFACLRILLAFYYRLLSFLNYWCLSVFNTWRSIYLMHTPQNIKYDSLFLNEKSPMALNILHVDHFHHWSYGNIQAYNDNLNLNLTICNRNR